MPLLSEQEPRPIFIDPMNPGDSHEWFVNNGLNHTVQSQLLRLFGVVSKPTVAYRTDPDTGYDAFEEIKKHVPSGNPTFFRMNHEAIHDFVNDSSVVVNSLLMNAHAGGFRIPAGLSYYNKRPIGWFFSMVGAYPADRKIDQIKHLLKTGEFTSFEQASEHVNADGINEERATFNAQLLTAALKKVVGEKPEGDDDPKPAQASYPQGTRRPHGEIGELHDDWHKILTQLDNPEDAKIIVLSKSYRGGKLFPRLLTPSYIVDIIDAPHGIVNKSEANAELKSTMERGVKEADSISRETVLSPLAKAGLGVAAVAVAAATAFALKRKS